MYSKSILFEPWALGDALIAAALFTLKQDEYVLVCQKKWKPIILETINSIKANDIIGIETSYESKIKGFAINYSVDQEIYEYDGCPVYSIRGDVRDYYVAKKIFKKSSVYMNGWISFLARKIYFFDTPFRYGLLKVKNRYEMWVDMLGLDFELLKKYYFSKLVDRKEMTGKVGIHIGAKWRSKQFPNAKKLAELMSERGKIVQILAGKDDLLPDGISVSEVKIVMGENLVDELKGYDFVVTNDSGPMHLAALLGVKTIAVGLVSNIDIWIPPSVMVIRGEKMPKGYAPLSSYWADEVVGGWPSPETIVNMLVNWKLI